MMRITRIEPVTKTKYRVSVDEQFAFVVYKGELSRFHLKEECELTEDTYAKIKEVLLKRAKLRAMHLLNDMARTESQLRDKLKLGGYPSEITEAAIAYVKSFGYINDDAYIRNFIDSRKDKKSRREIYALLRQKGVPIRKQSGSFFAKNTGTLPVQIRKKSRKYMDIWCGKDFVTKISVK